MSVVRVSDPISKSMTRNDEGEREYKIVRLVETSSILDGP